MYKCNMWLLFKFTILHWRLQTVIPPWIKKYRKNSSKIFHLKQLSCKELHSHRPRSGSFGRGHFTLEDCFREGVSKQISEEDIWPLKIVLVCICFNTGHFCFHNQLLGRCKILCLCKPQKMWFRNWSIKAVDPLFYFNICVDGERGCYPTQLEMCSGSGSQPRKKYEDPLHWSRWSCHLRWLTIVFEHLVSPIHFFYTKYLVCLKLLQI